MKSFELGRVHSTAIVSDGVKLGRNVTIGAHTIVRGKADIGGNVTIGSCCLIGEDAARAAGNAHSPSRTQLGTGTRVSSGARIHGGVSIGKHNVIGEYAVVRPGVVTGSGTVLHPHTVIEECVTLGKGVQVFCGTCIGKRPAGAGATARPVKSRGGVTIGDGCALGPNAVVFSDVTVGHNTLVGDGASLREQLKIGHHCIVGRHVTINYCVHVGNHTRIMDLSHITGNCRIGSNVFISVLVATANDNLVIGRRYREDDAIGPTIEDDATIGAGAVILPRVRIGRGAFVAAGSVVTRDVERLTLVMGSPARFVRKLKSGSAS